VDIEKENFFKRMGLLMQVLAYLFLTAFFFFQLGTVCAAAGEYTYTDLLPPGSMENRV
jgi:hypothetical protein